MKVRAIGIIGNVVTIVFLRQLGKRRVFGDKRNDIHSEAIYALAEPEIHHIKDLFSDGRVLPVQIGLLLRKIMQVIGISIWIKLPRVTIYIKETPAVSRCSFFNGPPMKIMAIWIIPAAAALPEPLMFVAAMIG